MPKPKASEVNLPGCPIGLPRRVAEKWMALLMDMVEAGIAVQQVDSRSIAIAANLEVDLEDLEAISGDSELPVEKRLATIRLKNYTRKDYLAALMAIGGTPIVRLRARISPEEPPKQKSDDPWSQI